VKQKGFSSGKKRLCSIYSRVRFITKRIDELTIARDTPKDQTRIFFGAWVTLSDDDDKQVTYQIVGPDEFNTSSRKIGIDSPMAKALLKKQVGNEVTINTPTGKKVFYINKIEYSEKGTL
jgi:transcription elongation factor GreB